MVDIIKVGDPKIDDPRLITMAIDGLDIDNKELGTAYLRLNGKNIDVDASALEAAGIEAKERIALLQSAVPSNNPMRNFIIQNDLKGVKKYELPAQEIKPKSSQTPQTDAPVQKAESLKEEVNSDLEDGVSHAPLPAGVEDTIKDLAAAQTQPNADGMHYVDPADPLHQTIADIGEATPVTISTDQAEPAVAVNDIDYVDPATDPLMQRMADTISQMNFSIPDANTPADSGVVMAKVLPSDGEPSGVKPLVFGENPPDMQTHFIAASFNPADYHEPLYVLQDPHADAIAALPDQPETPAAGIVTRDSSTDCIEKMQKGDTIWSMVQDKYDVDGTMTQQDLMKACKEIMDLNNIQDPTKMQIGQSVRLPEPAQFAAMLENRIVEPAQSVAMVAPAQPAYEAIKPA